MHDCIKQYLELVPYTTGLALKALKIPKSALLVTHNYYQLLFAVTDYMWGWCNGTPRKSFCLVVQGSLLLPQGNKIAMEIVEVHTMQERWKNDRSTMEIQLSVLKYQVTYAWTPVLQYSFDFCFIAFMTCLWIYKAFLNRYTSIWLGADWRERDLCAKFCYK